VVTSAGEALPVELYERWREAFGVELLDGLGTAEMWHIFISNRPGAARAGTLGQVVPGFDVRVCDEEGRELPRGETGWLWVRGASRAIGYWQQQERSQQAFRGDWYVSGDLIAMDEDGYVSYCGRGDELLKVSGKWLAPAEVEGCLLQHEAVAEAAVVGFPHAIKGQGIYAYVLVTAEWARQAGPELEGVLKEQVRKAIGGFAAPDVVHVAPGLPKTRSGKIMRRILRKIAASEYEGLGDITTLAEPEVVERLIAQHRQRTAPAR
jgi:benzoate-CoA ligase